MICGATEVYDKNGKYIGLAAWARPTDEITPEERKIREQRFNAACFRLMEAPVDTTKKPRPETVTKDVEMTPELEALIAGTVQSGRIDNAAYMKAIGKE